MNIKKIYFDNIIKGIKLHEYRLANEKRRNIQIGDSIILTCNETLETTTVIVKGINIYPSWKIALNKTIDSLKDFTGLYSSIDDVIDNVSSFYTSEEISKYGIIVFDIYKK